MKFLREEGTGVNGTELGGDLVFEARTVKREVEGERPGHCSIEGTPET